jgi:hypothetical protein
VAPSPLTLDYSSTQQFLVYSIGKAIIAKNPTVLAFLEPESKLML